MKYKIWNILKNVSIIFTVLLGLTFGLHAFAITITPDNQFIVENETYTVYQTMDFHTITVGPSYIIFNTTGFYISSNNDITITMVYLSDDIYGASDGDKVLEFYADTTSGTVSFSLSGFQAGNNYTVNRGGNTIGTPTANGSGFISFTNNVWSTQLFEIIQEGEGVVNNPPVVSNIPDQSILEGESFAQINLDDYVSDTEDPDEDIDWSYSGNTDLLVSIDSSRVATVSTPGSDWFGVETITFTAEDTGGLTDSDEATFMVTAFGAPLLSGLSISNGAEGVSVITSSLSIIIENPDGYSLNWTIETVPNIGSNYGSNESNGSKSCIISDLAYFTTYHWFVNATDGTHWTNGSYFFTTTTAPSYYQPPPPQYPPMDDEEQNNPPETPIKPSGPTLVEMGVEYTYSSSTFDVDGDQVCFRFDWGDGNFSDWSDFVDSNTSVSRSYHWSSILTYEVRVIAQNIDGLNSNWSPALNVTVSQADLGIPPVVIINISGNFSVNETIVFNASGSYDIDGFIVSYIWDFGDGDTGSGISPVHVYKQPGEYTVTLVITDNNGTTYSKSVIVNVSYEIEELGSGEQRGVPLFDFALIIIGFLIAVFACLVIFFREKVKGFVSTHIINPFSNVIISHREHKLKKPDAGIKEINEEMKNIRAEKKVAKQLPVRNMAGFYGEIDEGDIKADFKIESTDEEMKSFNEFDKYRTGEKIDKLGKQGLKPDKMSVEVKVDTLISVVFKERPRKFDTIKDDLLSEGDEDSIERKIDNLYISKMRESIDEI